MQDVRREARQAQDALLDLSDYLTDGIKDIRDIRSESCLLYTSSDWNIKDDVFYAYGRDNFIVITGHGEKIRQYYNCLLYTSPLT